MKTASAHLSTVSPAGTTVADPFVGEILDGDGHMYMFPDVAAEIFGTLEKGFVTSYLEKFAGSDQFKIDRERNRRELWNVKGLGALGAYDAQERTECLDLMGVKAQLVFPNNGSGEAMIPSEAAFLGVRRYNDYALEFQRATKNRARMVLQINQTDPKKAIEELDRIIPLGAKAIGLAANLPPGGVSPAHELWDPFWARLEEANVVATLHLGCGGLMSAKKHSPMLPDRGWGDAASLKGTPLDRPGGEEAISPYFMLVAHIPAELYLQTMVMGQVFERFPKLRFGIIEIGAKWVGPCVERMDLWVDFMAKVGRSYKMRPSDYVKRNVRVTPFWHENLALMVQRYGLDDVYIYSTDYPHLEGSRDPIDKFNKWLKQMPPEYAQKFFVDNAKVIFPD